MAATASDRVRATSPARPPRAQDDFEMAVAKVMKKDSEKNMSLRKLWK